MKSMEKLIIAVFLGAFSAYLSFAADPAELTRSQWLKKIGESASDETSLVDTVKRLAPTDRVEFSRRLYKAISRMPVSPEEKGARFVKAVVSLLRGNVSVQRSQIVAEAFAEIPIPYLPAVTEELSKHFGQELNKLSDPVYEKIAGDILGVCMTRNAKTDEPVVRNTFAALVFIRGAKNADSIKDKLIAKFTDEQARKVAADLVPGVVASQDYKPLLEAAGIDQAEKIVLRNRFSIAGHTNLERLLADLNANMKPLVGEEKEKDEGEAKVSMPAENIRTGGSMDGYSGSPLPWHPVDLGLERVPRPLIPVEIQGYQNQRTSIWIKGSSKRGKNPRINNRWWY